MQSELQTNELPIADVDEALAEVDPALLDLVPLEMCQRYRILPLARKGNALVIGFYKRLTSLAVYDIQLLTGLRVVSVRLREHGGGNMPSLSSSSHSHNLPQGSAPSLQRLLGTRKTPAFTRPRVVPE